MSAVFMAACTGPTAVDGGVDAGTGAELVWDDAWRSFTVSRRGSAFMTVCANQLAEVTVNLDTREVRYAGCFHRSTTTGVVVLSEGQVTTLIEALRRVATSSRSCLADAALYRLRATTPAGEVAFYDATAECTASGTRVDGLPAVFELLIAAVPNPVWDPSKISFAASQTVVFGQRCTASPISTWSFDLVSGRFTFSVCRFPTIVTDSRTLSTTEGDRLRAALASLMFSRRTACGADKPEQSIDVFDSLGAVSETWSDDFYACRPSSNVTFVEGIDTVFSVLNDLSVVPSVDAGVVDAGPSGPAWPVDAQQVTVKRLHTFFGPLCAQGDGGVVTESRWTVDLDSGVIDYAVCYPSENLYVVDAGALLPAQLSAFNAAANAIVFSPPLVPPCSADTDIDRFTVTSPAGTLSFQDSLDHCAYPPGVFSVINARAAREVLEAATHP
ncbi:MAG: hypothetical protein QM817_14940 [Archangium sp.]